MKKLSRTHTSAKRLPVRVLQFGEGNFLRAFADWMIDLMNEKCGYQSGVVVVQPLPDGQASLLNKQEGLYHHLMRGIENGRRINRLRLISCIQKAVNPYKSYEEWQKTALIDTLQVVISNTTEAGIAIDKHDIQQPDEGLARSFPGKVTQLLWHRYKHFNGDPERGLVFLPTELINNNGTELKKAVRFYIDMWKLPPEFANWLDKHNYFANTLVDRIVPGYPREEAAEIEKAYGFYDPLLVTSELFHLWVIEGNETIRKAFPAHQCGLRVIYTTNLQPYRLRKVRILNGTHTCMVATGLLSGLQTVTDCMQDRLLGRFIRHLIYKEIAPALQLPGQELDEYSEKVLERFSNPFIHHKLSSIALNSISKFRVRVLPAIFDFTNKFNTLPEGLVLSFACLIHLYLQPDYPMADNPDVTAVFNRLRTNPATPEEIVKTVLQLEPLARYHPAQIPGLPEKLTGFLAQLQQNISPSHLISHILCRKEP